MTFAHASLRACLSDEGDGSKVQVIGRGFAQNGLPVDAVGRKRCVIAQLRGAPHEGQALVVIQAPHSMGPCWLQPACSEVSERLPKS